MMKIGFSKKDISPPVGMELGGYAGYRPCAGVYDPLWCKAVVLEQEDGRYALVALDLMCVDEPLYHRIAEAVASLGIRRKRLIVCAIHSHAAPAGMIPGAGVLAEVNAPVHPQDPMIRDYMNNVVTSAAQACAEAAATMEAFQVRTARGGIPPVGSERHTGDKPAGALTAIQCRTVSGRLLTVYNFPCHPTVTNAENLQASADFVAGIESRLGGEMAVFLNGAAGDISTRFTRRESTFRECDRMGAIAAEAVRELISQAEFCEPEPLQGTCETIVLKARETDAPEVAEKALAEATALWQEALSRGENPDQVRILKSYVEGAGVNLEFARTMAGITQLHLPVSVFRLWGLNFMSVPGELFSALLPEDTVVIAYANGYFRYICDRTAYDRGYYEALAAIVAPGEGEHLMESIQQMQNRLV